jgi:hypothetical protein
MKQTIINNPFLFPLCFTALSVGIIHSCRKDAGVFIPTGTPSDSVITTSFKEEFKDVYSLTTNSGWVIKDNSDNGMGTTNAFWSQGMVGTDKSGNPYGFPAYSYSSSKTEYIYSAASAAPISSWLITPLLSVKNGDKISFYTRGDANGNNADRMQVLMDKSTSPDVGDSINSVGSFTTVLFDINSAQAVNGYPVTWTKYEYTFSGISGKINTRIAFRRYVTGSANAMGIGMDVFEFRVN